jgi:carbonic anhydrase
MQQLVLGIHRFRSKVFAGKQELFNKLAKGQNPSALFITCSDSRINPNLVTQTEPGELFVIRNAGNIIPASPETGGELASIEFAIKGLGIQDIIICGHSDCGAMKGVLSRPSIGEGMPHLSSWLRHAQRTKDIMATQYRHLDSDRLLTATVEENVLVQIENLKSHAFIAEALEQERLKIHAWVYKFETGQVFYYDPLLQQYLLFSEEDSPSPTLSHIPHPSSVDVSKELT